MTTMAKLKDNFKNFEKQFDSQILNKKEFSSLITTYYNGMQRNPHSNVENDFIRVYDLKDGTSLGFGFNNIEIKKDDRIKFYEELFNEVLKNNQKYSSIKEYISNDINDLLNESKILYNSKFPRLKPFAEFNSNFVKEIAQELVKEEFITITYYDKDKSIYSKTFNFSDFKEEFKKTKSFETLDKKTLIKSFNLKANGTITEKENIFNLFKEKHKDEITNLVILQDNVKEYTKDFEETSKICDKLIQEFSKKIYAQYGYDDKRTILNNEQNKLTKQEQEIFGYYSNTGLIEDFYYETISSHNIGLNKFKKDLETKVKDLDSSFLEKDDIEFGGR